MLPASFRVKIFISAPPEIVFAYVADLVRHGEWSSDPVHIQAISPGQVAIGSRYKSTAQSRGVSFSTDLEVTRYEPPASFGFEGEDATGKFRHEFTLHPHHAGTLVRREIHFRATLAQWLIFFLVLNPVRIPSAKRTLQLLKQKVEGDLQLNP